MFSASSSFFPIWSAFQLFDFIFFESKVFWTALNDYGQLVFHKKIAEDLSFFLWQRVFLESFEEFFLQILVNQQLTFLEFLQIDTHQII